MLMAAIPSDKLQLIQNAVTTRRSALVDAAAARARQQANHARAARVRDALFGQRDREQRILSSIGQAYRAAQELRS